MVMNDYLLNEVVYTISCFVNFKENLSKNIPYYSLLSGKLGDASKTNLTLEHAAISAGENACILSRICEGYQFVIAFFGKLFDTEALRSELSGYGYRFTSGCDGELALYSYIHFGEKSPEKYSGKFSYIIYDSMRRQVFAVSSAYPLFYAEKNDSVFLSSSLDGILSCTGIAPRITREGVSRLLSPTAGCVAEVFEDIHLLPDSCFLKLSQGSLFKRSYYTPEYSQSIDEFIDGCEYDNPGIVFLGGNDSMLYESIARREEKLSRRVSIYTPFPVKRTIQGSPKIYRLSPDEGSVLSGLEASVSSAHMPILSASDFLLPSLIKYASGRSHDLFTVPEAICTLPVFCELSKSNHLLHPRVYATLLPPSRDSCAAIDTYSLISERLSAPLKIPYAPATVSEEADFSYILPPLKHLLLDIISKDYAPLLAFFRRSGLLCLCEGAFGFDSRLECAIIAYLIKLNIWFIKYRPMIV